MVIALLDAPWQSGVILILYLIIEQFKSNFLPPYIMSKQVSLLPAVSLVSQVFFTIFFLFFRLITFFAFNCCITNLAQRSINQRYF